VHERGQLKARGAKSVPLLFHGLRHTSRFEWSPRGDEHPGLRVHGARPGERPAIADDDDDDQGSPLGEARGGRMHDMPPLKDCHHPSVRPSLTSDRPSVTSDRPSALS
jgi:hypothetical protein